MHVSVRRVSQECSKSVLFLIGVLIGQVERIHLTNMEEMGNSHTIFVEKSEWKRHLGTPEFGPKFQENVKIDLKETAQ
jgi:hypothetical protein